MALTRLGGLATVYPEDANFTCMATEFTAPPITWWRMGTQFQQSARFNIHEVSVDVMNVMSRGYSNIIKSQTMTVNNKELTQQKQVYIASVKMIYTQKFFLVKYGHLSLYCILDFVAMSYYFPYVGWYKPLPGVYKPVIQL